MQLSLFKVYKGIFSQKTGTDCPANLSQDPAFGWAAIALFYGLMKFCWVGLLLFISLQALAQISLPSPPAASAPPVLPTERSPISVRRQENNDKKDADKTRLEENVDSIRKKKQTEELEREVQKPRELYGFFESSLLYTKVITTGDRTGYTSDPTVHLSLWGRVAPIKSPDVTQLWAGFRLAPFHGSGKQDIQTGRYALTFVGPGIGFGKMQISGDRFEKDSSTTGWIIATGFAGVVKAEQSADQPVVGENDFTSTPWFYDLPGVWVEYRYIHMFMGALSYNYVAGCQLATNKNYIYLGVGLAGWL